MNDAGFPFNDPLCGGCGKELLVENAWMTDGCPCNSPFGVNNQNAERWRLLMQLQQQQSAAADRLVQKNVVATGRIEELEKQLRLCSRRCEELEAAID